VADEGIHSNIISDVDVFSFHINKVYQNIKRSVKQFLSNEGDILWDPIIAINLLGFEQVYDIEVAGTHNFVAGHYIDARTGNALTQDQEEVVALRQELGTWNSEMLL